MCYDATCQCYIYNLSTKTGFSANNDYTVILYIGTDRIAAIEIHANR